MYNSYWCSFAQLKFCAVYYDLYAKRDEKCRLASEIISGLVTLLCVFLWSYFPDKSIWWSALIVASQAYAFYIDKTKPAQRACALKYYLLSLTTLLNEMSYKLRDIQNLIITDNSEINSLIRYFEDEEQKINERYISPINVPDDIELINKSDLITNSYLEQINKGDGTYESRSEANSKTATASAAN